MRTTALTLVLVLVYLGKIFAQNSINELGARSTSLGNAYSTVNDKFALLNNPGGIGGLKETSALASFKNNYGVSGLNSMAAGALSSLPIGTAGITVFRFGDDIYNEQIASLVYANKFGIASLGIRANYVQYTQEGLGSQGNMTIDFGGTASITEVIGFGAYIRNINQAQLKDSREQNLPTLLYAGLSIKPTNKILLAIETEKDLDNDAVFKAGLEYKFLDKFFARTGIKTDDFTNHFGIGFISQKLGIDYAMTWHQTLGLSHELSLAYTIKR